MKGTLWCGDLWLSSWHLGGQPQSDPKQRRLINWSGLQQPCYELSAIHGWFTQCFWKWKVLVKFSWSSCEVVKAGSAMRFARRNCASCELEGRIYAIGGPELQFPITSPRLEYIKWRWLDNFVMICHIVWYLYITYIHLHNITYHIYIYICIHIDTYDSMNVMHCHDVCHSFSCFDVQPGSSGSSGFDGTRIIDSVEAGCTVLTDRTGSILCPGKTCVSPRPRQATRLYGVWLACWAHAGLWQPFEVSWH